MPEDAFVEPAAPPHSRNAGSPVQVRTLDQLLRLKNDQQLADMKAVLATPEGRRLLWRLLEHTDIYASTYSHNHATASFLEGKREVGTTLITWISAVDPAEYPRLMVEGARDRETDEQIRQARIAEQKSREIER